MPTPVGHVRMALHLTRVGDAEPYLVTFGARITGGWSSDFNAGALIMLHDALKGIAGTNTTFSKLVSRVGVDGADDEVFESGGSLTGSGTSAGVMPPQVAALIRKITSVGGRRGRGRIFWPYVEEGAADNVGVLAAATVSAYSAAWNDVRQRLETGTQTNTIGVLPTNAMVLFRDSSVRQDGTPVPELAPVKINSLSCQALVATQRRRLRK